jgi:predicted RNA-binding Zn-ribbon protein involved in translation (DUF1610 family)
MSKFIEKAPFYILFIIGLISLFFVIYDIVFDSGLFIVTILIFIFLIFITFVLLLMKIQRQNTNIDIFKEFEKKLSGGLFHFKCPTCDGFFAIKKSKRNNKKPLKMTCPDCGAFGIIPPKPLIIEDRIPENKSINADFLCRSCGEGITLWAEGKKLYEKISIFTCPFCGKEETMKRA